MAIWEGWKNWETWNMNQWISNEASVYKWALDLADEVDGDVEALAEALEEEIGAFYEDVDFKGAGFFGQVFQDYLSHSFEAVNWRELAEHYAQACLEENK